MFFWGILYYQSRRSMRNFTIENLSDTIGPTPQMFVDGPPHSAHAMKIGPACVASPQRNYVCKVLFSFGRHTVKCDENDLRRDSFAPRCAKMGAGSCTCALSVKTIPRETRDCFAGPHLQAPCLQNRAAATASHRNNPGAKLIPNSIRIRIFEYSQPAGNTW